MWKLSKAPLISAARGVLESRGSPKPGPQAFPCESGADNFGEVLLHSYADQPAEMLWVVTSVPRIPEGYAAGIDATVQRVPIS